MTTLRDIEIQQVRDETIRQVILGLTRNARDPERIGRRVLSMYYALRLGGNGQSLLNLSQQLGVSVPAASMQASTAAAELHRLRFLKRLSEAPPVAPNL